MRLLGLMNKVKNWKKWLMRKRGFQKKIQLLPNYFPYCFFLGVKKEMVEKIAFFKDYSTPRKEKR